MTRSSSIDMADYKKRLDAYLEDGFKIDDTGLTSHILGSTSGLSLLSALLWRLHDEKLVTGFTNELLGLVLEKGADPNIRLNGYTPAELLVISAARCNVSGRALCEITQTLVKKGMNAHQVCHFSNVEEFIEAASKVRDGDYFRHILFDGPRAVLLEKSTPRVLLSVPRRTL